MAVYEKEVIYLDYDKRTSGVKCKNFYERRAGLSLRGVTDPNNWRMTSDRKIRESVGGRTSMRKRERERQIISSQSRMLAAQFFVA